MLYGTKGSTVKNVLEIFGQILVSFLGPTYNIEQVCVALVGLDDALS